MTDARQCAIDHAAARRAALAEGLEGPIYDGPDLSEANLREANLSSADLRGAKLSYANLSSADLRGADLRGADLRGAKLSYANLREADLRDADLSKADLTEADLHHANLSSAKLDCANLDCADLREADLRRAKGFRDGMPDARSLRLAVADQIEAHPGLHDQGDWGAGDPNECDTPCCVGGWACRLGGGTYGQSVASAATRLLWLDGAPLPPFSGEATREAIITALRTMP